MSLLEIKIRQGGWHEYNYYFDMRYHIQYFFPIFTVPTTEIFLNVVMWKGYDSLIIELVFE
jgi:hypothetical protein